MTKKTSEKPKQPKAKYHIPKDFLARVWEESDNATEVEEKIRVRNEALGLPVPPKPVILAMAAAMRKEGVHLKRFPFGRRPANQETSAVNKIIESIRRERQAAAAAPAPAVNPELAIDVIKTAVVRALEELRARAAAPPPPSTGTTPSPEEVARAIATLRQLGLA